MKYSCYAVIISPIRVNHLITQNVDRLHHKAGSQKVTELHGTLHEVYCLNCGHRETRDTYQSRLSALNAAWLAEPMHPMRNFAPDGDVIIPQEYVRSFKVRA